MTNTGMLEQRIRESGMKRCVIAERCGINQRTLRNKIQGKSEFTATEIVALSRILSLSGKVRDEIFLAS